VNLQLLSTIDRSFRQKINKKTSELKYTTDQMELTGFYRILYSTTTEYTFFSVGKEFSLK
jgi:hypothetical protein